MASGKLLFVALACCIVASVAIVPNPHKYPVSISPPPPTDPCNQWLNCTTCLNHKFCGWCSTDVIYQNGAPGFQCAGFGPNNSSNPFVCVGTYSTEKCLQGYNCSAATQQCIPAPLGDGLPLDQCTAGCFPKTYSCSPVNVTCVETDVAHGGIPLDICQLQCASQNSTPASLVGYWRGLEISAEYTAGEWDLDLGANNASLYSPSGLVWSGSVSSVQDYVVVTITSGQDAGDKIYALYQTQTGPVTTWTTIAASKPGAAPPTGFDDAMTDPAAQEFVFESCAGDAACNFGPAASPSKLRPTRKVVPAAPAPTSPPYDHCSVFPNCSACLNSPYCGWCSTDVIYQGGILGKNCAGFNPNITNDPFVCVGTYSTVKCPVPPPGYQCDAASKQCILSQSGGMPQSVCNATCGKNVSTILYKCNVATLTCEPDEYGQNPALCNQTCQLEPFPIDLLGVWRGLEVSQNYTRGEWHMVIDALNATTANFSITDPLDITLSGIFQHVAAESVLIVHITAPVVANQYSQFQIAYGPETNYLTLANGVAGSDTYPSFIQAMTGSGMSELTFVKCLNPNNCKFVF